jgi:tetratricopeptide (TPR) repeat protein
MRRDRSRWDSSPAWPSWMGSWARALEKRISKREDPQLRADRRLRLVDRQIRVHGPSGLPTARARIDAADSLVAAGRNAEAVELRREVVETYERNLGREDLATLEQTAALAELLSRAGQRTEAMDLMQRVYNSLLRALGPQNQSTQWARGFLALLRDGDSAQVQEASAPRTPPTFSVSTGRVRHGGDSGTSSTGTARVQRKKGDPPA